MAWKKVEQAPTWEFEKQKTIEGVFVSKEENVGPNHSNLYTLELPDHSHLAVWGNTILDTRFKNLQPGDQVKIEYLGKKKSKKRKGAEYHDFEVYHWTPEEGEEGFGEEPGEEV